MCSALAADLAAALLLTMLALGPAQAESDAPIELGLIEAMSGAFSNAGSVAKANIQIAIDRINQAGGIHLADGNHRVALTTFDSQNSTEQALFGLTQLSDRGVRIFLQGNSSAVALTLVDAIERHNQRMPDQALLFLNYSAVDPALTNAHCSFWHFRFDANSNMRMNALTDVLQQDPQVHRVFLIGQDYVFGRQVAAVARQMIQAKRPDIDIVGDLLHPIGQVRDFAPYIARIQASRADAVVTGNWGSDLSLLVKAARQAGLTARFYTFYGDSLGAPEEIGTAGINQVLAVSEWNPNSTPAALAYARAYRAHFRDAAASYQFLRIDVMLQMLAQALQQAGRIDARAVAQALETGHFVNGFFEARMRATDHQIDEPLVVSRLVAIDPNDAQHIDQEGSGLGFLPVRYFSAAQTRLRSTCVMRR